MKLGDMKLGDIIYVQNIGNWVGTRKKYEIRRYMKLGDMKLGDINCITQLLNTQAELKPTSFIQSFVHAW